MKTHYRFVQVVNVVTRGQAILDKIWTNMEEVYCYYFRTGTIKLFCLNLMRKTELILDA